APLSPLSKANTKRTVPTFTPRWSATPPATPARTRPLRLRVSRSTDSGLTTADGVARAGTLTPAGARTSIGLAAVAVARSSLFGCSRRLVTSDHAHTGQAGAASGIPPD